MPEEKTVIKVTPDQVLDPGQELPDLVVNVNLGALDDMTMGQYAALQTPDKVPLYNLIGAIDALTIDLDVYSLKKDELSLVAERIGEALEFRRAGKNSDAP